MVLNYAEGWIDSGQWFHGSNGPEGWDAVASNSFPLPGSRPYALIGSSRSSSSSDTFYLGQSGASAINREAVAKTFFLRTNADTTSGASGQFFTEVQVWSKADEVASDFVTQTIPTTVLAGQQVPVSITMKNVGTTTWDTGHFSITPQPDNGTWTTVADHPPLPSNVLPGAQVTFSFSVPAPSTPGTYNVQWRMRKNWDYFGDRTDNVVVTVLAPSNQSAFVSQTVPARMTGGEPNTVTIKMKNIGNTTWDAGTGYKLGSQNPQDNTTWFTSRADLTSPVPPGGTAVFTFMVWAPGTAGSTNFQWRMLREGVEWFGPSTPNLVISVKNPPCFRC